MMMMMMMMMMMKKVSLWTLQQIISSVEDRVSVLVLQLCTIIIIRKQLQGVEDVVRAWRELLGLREDVVRTYCKRDELGAQIAIICWTHVDTMLTSHIHLVGPTSAVHVGPTQVDMEPS